MARKTVGWGKYPPTNQYIKARGLFQPTTRLAKDIKADSKFHISVQNTFKAGDYKKIVWNLQGFSGVAMVTVDDIRKKFPMSEEEWGKRFPVLNAWEAESKADWEVDKARTFFGRNLVDF